MHKGQGLGIEHPHLSARQPHCNRTRLRRGGGRDAAYAPGLEVHPEHPASSEEHPRDGNGTGGDPTCDMQILHKAVPAQRERAPGSARADCADATGGHGRAPGEPAVPEALARADLGALDCRAAARIVDDGACVHRAAGDRRHGFALVLFRRQHAVLLHARLAVPDLQVAAVVRKDQHGRAATAELVPEVPHAARERRPHEDLPGDGVRLDELVAVRARRRHAELVAPRVEAEREQLARGAEADDAPHRHLHPALPRARTRDHPRIR